MQSYSLPAQELPLDDRYDVIVAGGGPAGCAAAAAAARAGARALLIEGTGCLGGMGTSGLVPAWCPFTDQEKIIYGGIAERVFRACKAGIAHIPESRVNGWLPLDPERLKRIYDDLVTEAGADVLFLTQVLHVERGPDGIAALICGNKAGLTAYRARVYVDCTGDADLAARAGAEFEVGDEDGLTMPFTHCFLLSNVDSYAFQNAYDPACTGNWRFRGSPVWDMMDAGTHPRVGFMCANLVGPGTVGMNAGHLNDYDALDPQQMSQALIEGRKTAAEYRDALAEHFPQAFGNAYLAATGSLMGVRETRRVIGDYLLSAADYLDRRSFPDEICRNAYIIDIHRRKSELDEEEKARLDQLWRNVPRDNPEHPAVDFPVYGPGESHGIPYRCLTPKGLANVLVAGRSISCDRVMQSSVRVMPVCLTMGEAAGIAAAQALEAERPDVHTIDTDRLRATLRAHGAYLP